MTTLASERGRYAGDFRNRLNIIDNLTPPPDAGFSLPRGLNRKPGKGDD
jgi:hypothetical protein